MAKKPHPVCRMVSGPGTGTIWFICPVCHRVPGWRNSRNTPRCQGTKLYWPSWELIPDEWLLPEEMERRKLKCQPAQ